jgi:prepilin-type N-terminal cleavage/methylation domain-containing protein/prepilin-type processing-associated H-X9-DG protein
MSRNVLKFGISPGKGQKMKRKAFTLIELLVVIAIIALLLSIVMPSLQLVKKKAASIVCLTNAKNLSLAWFSYKEDNDDNIMSSEMNGITVSGGRVPGWCGQPRTKDTLLSEISNNVVTDEDEIRGIERGALYDYLEAPNVYNCPADKVKALVQYDTVDPEKFVTYAVPTCLAGPTSRRILKFSEITSPSDRYNFVETAEERNFTTDLHWIFGAPEYPESGGGPAVWWGPMAVNHGDSSILGFCDGHAEVHKWQESWTKERVVKLSEQKTERYDADTESGHNATNDVDIAYMYKGWAYRYKP